MKNLTEVESFNSKESLKMNYDKWHTSVHGKENPSDLCLDGWHKSALEMYSDVAGKKVLEVGCGVGDFAIHLDKLGAFVTAVDFSDSAIEMAKQKAVVQKRDINFDVADAQKLPFSAGEFDIIFSCECLEHIPDPQAALDEFSRVLKPNGRLVLTTENYSNGMIIYWMISWLQNKPFDSGGGQIQPIENFFLYWQVIKKMKKAGFELLELDGWHFVFLVIPGMHPHKFVKEHIANKTIKKTLKPFARHMTFLLEKI